MLKHMVAIVMCLFVHIELSSSSFTQHINIRPLKYGNMLLDFSFHMEYVLRKQCSQRQETTSCVWRNVGAPLELAQLYEQLPMNVSIVTDPIFDL